MRAFAEDFRQSFKPQLDYFRQKVSLPTKGWRDLDGRAHDRAFVVAGVEKEAVLSELRQAIDKAIDKGTTLEEFRRDFDKTVEKHGWIGGAGEDNRDWRTRVIYETNVRTSYQAGRLKQMRDPDVLELRPWWMYRHADIRTPETPRIEHQGWDGLILRHDDTFWQTHFPPNGWLCSCGARPLSRRERDREQEKRGKPAGPDEAPPLNLRPVKDPKTGDIVMVPEGIDFGWAHQPGDSWERGLVPSELQRPLPASDALPPGGRGNPKPADLPPLRDVARPSRVGRLKEGEAVETYVDAVLGLFGAARGENGAAIHRDMAGGAVVISEKMFQTQDGAWKVFKRARAGEYLRAAEALKDPDEIWVDWDRNERTGKTTLRRRYLRHDGDKPSVAVFEYGEAGWEAKTLFTADDADPRKRDAYIETQRHGALLYRRQADGAQP
ncbi:PBECR2 nuclease fold domain-containing protein [Bosea sp. TWI1241]|uniref:PBECR2 nuclease fold domain-containing protein n=1 Tax=Bosea sp. TWI1241 TaxID=3148904 RepID=UPI003207CC20